MKARFLLLVTVLLCTHALAAPPSKQQYIIKLKNPSSAAPLKDEVTHGGGHVDYEGWDRLVVTLPDNAVEAIARHASTKYMQLVTSHSATSAENATSLQSANSTSRSEADRLPAIPAKSSPLRASLHPTSLSFSPPWDSGTYSYDGAGNITGIGNDTFTYDSLSRLSTADIKGNAESYTYDAYGNLKLKTTIPAGGTPLIVDLTPSTANNNRLAAQAYDTAGNLTGDAGETNIYDSFSMMREKDVGGYGSEYYLYTANDERIAVISNSCVGAAPQNCSSARITVSPRDESGKVLRQFDLPYQQFATGPWLWLEDYVYRDGLLLAAERPAAEGGRRHFHLDHLGSPRLVTGPNGQQIAAHDYYPFGVEITPVRQETRAGLDREDPMKFTGHERDFNIGTSTENANYNDYMHSRFTVPQWGRFTSVDGVLDLTRARHYPQNWNRYSYVINNGLTYIDPSGDAWLPTIDPQTYTWTDECGGNFNCHDSVAVRLDDQHVRVYGPTSATDITDYTANAQGYIDLGALDPCGTYYTFQTNITATFTSPGTATAFYNTAELYREQNPTDAPLSLNDAGQSDGAAFAPHHTHDLGRAIDFRYIDNTGQPLIGLNAILHADDVRMQMLFYIGRAYGFNQNYSDNNVAYGTLWAPGHSNHGHMGRRRH
jgi:RHS repeat-associated protein